MEPADIKRPEYVIITPARNEEDYIEKTIRSVVSQTVLPGKWVIVSDGSTDRTDDIVKSYLPERPWLELVRISGERERQFGAKVHCFNAGYDRVRDVAYDIVGNLDADISFEPDYFEFLLDRFAENPELGVAGTPFVEGTSHYNYRFTNIEHVSGACQMFRRECFEAIGGYRAIPGGGQNPQGGDAADAPRIARAGPRFFRDSGELSLVRPSSRLTARRPTTHSPAG